MIKAIAKDISWLIKICLKVKTVEGTYYILPVAFKEVENEEEGYDFVPYSQCPKEIQKLIKNTIDTK